MKQDRLRKIRVYFKVLMYVLGRHEKNCEIPQSEYVTSPSEFEAGTYGMCISATQHRLVAGTQSTVYDVTGSVYYTQFSIN